jgi:hypothetical protein
MNTSAFLDSQYKEESHGFHPCHGGKGIVEVDAFPLHETACHQASLVLDDDTDFISLQLEHPLKGDHAVTMREISKLPGAVLLNCVHLQLHHGTPCRVSLGLCEGPRLTVVARKMQLRLQIVRGQSRHRLVVEKVIYRTIPQWLAVVVRVDALLIVGEWSSELHRVLNTSWCRSGRALRGGRRCWSAWRHRLWWWWRRPHCSRGRGVEVGRGSGTGIDMLGGRELPTPPAPSKWTYSTVKLSFVGVELSFTALSHAHPHPSSNTMSRVVRTHYVPGSRMR